MQFSAGLEVRAAQLADSLEDTLAESRAAVSTAADALKAAQQVGWEKPVSVRTMTDDITEKPQRMQSGRASQQ